jgi:hydroxymethylbilane synthase
MRPIRVGTRGSPLALWQAERIASRLAASGRDWELVRVVTGGDVDRETPLARLGKPALFSKELDEALLDGRIDVAVHSLKDLPTEMPEGIVLAAVSEREDPRDALVGRNPVSWSTLPPGATVATCSLRRQAQLLRLRPDLDVVEVRGNIGTRLEQLERNGGWAALILAVAGLVRLGLEERIGERLSLQNMLPAPGQAALAATARANDRNIIDLLGRFANRGSVELPVTAERALLAAVEGGCHAPVAAYAAFESADLSRLTLSARVVSLDGTVTVEGWLSDEVKDVSAAQRLGQRLAKVLIARGAGEIIEQARGAIGPVS